MLVRRSWLGLATAVVLAAALAGCDDDSTNSAPDLNGPGTGTLSVWYQDATGPVTELNIQFDALSIYNTQGEEVILAPPATTIDLIEAKDNPTKLGDFNIPAGDYNGVKAALEIVNFKVEGEDSYCLVEPSTYSFGPVLVQGTVLQVDESGNVSILIDIPVIEGTCDPNVGPVGTLSFGGIVITRRTM